MRLNIVVATSFNKAVQRLASNTDHGLGCLLLLLRGFQSKGTKDSWRAVNKSGLFDPSKKCVADTIQCQLA